MLARVVFGAILFAAFFGMKFVFTLGRRRFRKQDLEGSIRCPDCGAENNASNYRCSSCGLSLQIEQIGWRIMAYLPFLTIILLYLILRKFVFPGTF